MIQLLEGVVGVMIVAFFGTQVVWPIVRGTELFPLFSSQHRLERDLERARQPPASQGEADERLPIVFNDAGKGVVKGSINYELPLDENVLTAMHSAYPDERSLEAGLIRPALNKSVYLTGTLMTSYESYKEKRSLLTTYVEDQTQNGVYRTRTFEREIEEDVVGDDGKLVKQKKRVMEVDIERKDNVPVRAESGQLARFGVKAYNFAIESIDYDKTVTEQIAKQQALTMEVETSIASAKKAVQEKLTTEAQGAANAADAKWKQETIKAQAVTEAQQRKEVAELLVKEAAAIREAAILKADGEATARRKLMEADNALDRRLSTIEKVNETWAKALATYPGALVPSVVMGGREGGSGMDAMQTFMNVLTAQTAQQLGVTLSPRSGVSVQPQGRGAGGGAGAGTH